MRNDPDTCIVCHKPIPRFRRRYVIRNRFVSCTGCVERRSRLHQITAPDCPIEWHDAWDHADQLVIGCREGVAHILEKNGDPT